MDKLSLRDCPTCGDTSFDSIYRVSAKDFHRRLYGVSYATIVKCRKCGLVHTNPILNASLDEDQYTNPTIGYHSSDVKSPQKLVSIDQLFCMEEIKKRVRPSESRILDYGCGCGGLVYLCQLEGLSAKGIDLDANGILLGKELGIKDMNCSGIERESDESCNCVACIHVLEHCRDIGTTVKQFNRVLKPGGMCVVAVPNYRSLRFVVNPKRYWSEAYMHINGLTSHHLDLVFRENCFERVRMRAALPNRNRLEISKKTWISFCLTKWFGNLLRVFPTKLVCVYLKSNHNSLGLAM